MRRKLGLSLVGGIALLCTFVSWYFAQCVEDLSGYVGFYNEQPVISGEQLKDYYEKKQEDAGRQLPENAAWYLGTGKVSDTVAGRQRVCQIYHVLGNPHILFSDFLIFGNYPSSYDNEGCMISRGLSETLYQSSNCVGRKIKVEGKEKTVRGILRTSDELVVIQDEKKEKFSNISFFCQDPKTPLSVSQQMYYEITGSRPQRIMEGNFYGAVAGVIKTVPVIVFIFLMVNPVAAAVEKRYTFISKNMIWGLYLVILLIWVSLSFYFSADYLPSMWSNLDFWSDLWEEKRETYQVLKNSVLSLQDRQVMENLRKCETTSLAATFLYIYSFLKFPKKYKNPIDE